MKGIVLCLLLTITLAMGKRMQLSPTKASWQDAAADCASRTGDALPNILTNSQQVRLIQNMKDNNISVTWTGINRLHKPTVEKPWDWRYHKLSLKMDLQVNLFDKHEPDNRFEDEFCVAARRVVGGKPNPGLKIWNDAQCNNEYYYFCDQSSK